MDCNDFRAYVDLCRSRGLSDYQLAAMLGCGINSVVRWKHRNPPRYIGLAITTLEQNLKPWVAP